MAEINPNWARWIANSLVVYFEAVAEVIGVEMLSEGIEERTQAIMKSDRAEFRFNGPFIRQLSKGYFQLDVDTNILLTNLMDGENDNPYNLINWAGAFQQAAEKSIPVYRYGPDTDGVDDESLVGCLSVRGKKDGSDVYHFGQVSIVDRVRQSAVDTKHWMFLTVTE